MTYSYSVIDLSHNNTSVDLELAKREVLGVFHKATQGTVFVDHQYAPRRRQAENIGLLWGAYHFGSGDGDGQAQADHFLATALPNEHTLMVLDFEKNEMGESMTMLQAYDFIKRIFSQTGRWPGLYAGEYLRELLGGKPDAMLQNCWLWLADYRAPPPHILAGWPTWIFWQWTGSGAVAGVAGDCDRDVFNGSEDDLRKFWTGAE